MDPDKRKEALVRVISIRIRIAVDPWHCPPKIDDRPFESLPDAAPVRETRQDYGRNPGGRGCSKRRCLTVPSSSSAHSISSSPMNAALP